MEHQLKSNHLNVTINSKGAELSSVKLNGVEYLWQAKAEVWPRHAPVLFPIVGKLKENTFKFNDKNYSLSQHGFARDYDFKMTSQTENEITFELRNTATLQKLYPFEFIFQIKYSIEKSKIVCQYTISNPSSQANLFFSVGAHPGFKVPLLENEKFTDYTLNFHNSKKFFVTELADGLLTNTKKELALIDGDLKLTNDLFNADALVFEDSQIDSIGLRSIISGKGVELECKNWPYFGIWSKKGHNEFICLEPWYGIADSIDSIGDLETKKGIIQLKPFEEFDCSFSMRFF